MAIVDLRDLFGVSIPKECGGRGMPLSELVDTFIILSSTNLNDAAILGSHIRVAYYLDQFGTKEQRQHYLPRMANGEIIAAHAHTEREPTTATKTNNHFLINGHKPIVTNAWGANLLAVTTNDHAEVFLIDMPHEGVYIEKEVPRLALREVSICPVRLQGCVVKENSLLGGEEGRGLEYLHGSLGPSLVNGAARAIGATKYLIDYLIKNPPGDNNLDETIATLDGYTKAAEALTRGAAVRLERDQRDIDLALHAKWYSAEVATLVATKVHELLAYRVDALPLEQRLVDIQTLRIIGRRTEQLKEEIGRNILQAAHRR